MITWIKQQVGDWITSRKVSATAKVDHVEISSTHLIIGLQIDWKNLTNAPITAKEIQARLHLNKGKKGPLRLYPLGCFDREESQGGLQKSPIRPFTLPVGEIHTEQIRFISQEHLDIPIGDYLFELQLTDTNDNTHSNQLSLALCRKFKYRRSDEWQLEE